MPKISPQQAKKANVHTLVGEGGFLHAPSNKTNDATACEAGLS